MRKDNGELKALTVNSSFKGWELQEAVTRIGFLASGSYLLYAAYQVFWGGGDTLWHWQSVVFSYLTYGLGFGLLGLGVFTRDPKKYQVLILVSLLSTLLAQYYTSLINLRPGAFGTTDAALFSSYAAHLQWMGENPYTWNLMDSFSAYRVSSYFITPTLNGGIVTTITYPALHFLLLVPFKATGLEDVRVLYVVAYAILLALLFLKAPDWLRGIILLPLLVNTNYQDFTMGWVTDTVWTLFLVGMIASWRHRTGRAVFFGLACAYKQLPWLLAPFILIRLLIDSEDPDSRPGLLRTSYFFGIAAGIFLIINAPYLIADFDAWFSAVFEPLAGPMIYIGSGLSTLTQLDILPFPKEFYSLVTFSVMLVLAVLYVTYFRWLKHTVWLFPGLVLWFSYRSLQNYFIYWVPLLLVSALEILRESSGVRSKALNSGRLFPWRSEKAEGLERLCEKFDGAVCRLTKVVQGYPSISVALVSTVILVLGGGGIYFLLSNPPLRVELNSVTLDRGFHQIHQMEVSVFNTTSSTIAPRISVQRGSWQPYVWYIESGPDALQPGEWGIYCVSTDLPHRTFSLVEGAQIVVTDGFGNYRLRGTTRVGRDFSVLDPDAIFNSDYLRGSESDTAPWGWELSYSNVYSHNLRVGQATQSLRAMEMSFVPTSYIRDGDWSYVTLNQELLFPLGGLSLWVRPPTLSPNLNGTQSLVYGLEVEDGQHRLWMLFGPGYPREGYFDDDHYYVYRTVSSQSWSEQRIDLLDLYEQLGWSLPPLQRVVRGDLELIARQVNVSLLLAAREWDQSTTVSAEFGPLTVVPVESPFQENIEQTIEHEAEYYVALGDLAQRQRNYAVALTHYQTALMLDPHLPITYLRLGELHFQQGDYSTAQLRFREAVVLDSQLVDAYNGLGWSLTEYGRCEEAIVFFRRALDISPTSQKALLGMEACSRSR